MKQPCGQPDPQERLLLPMPDQRVLPSRPAALEQLCQRHVFPGRPAELVRLRRWLASLLPDTQARDDVMLVAVELATNAIKHTASGAGGYFTVEITCGGELGTVRVTVTDGGAEAGPVWPVSPDPLNEHGLGLQLVRALAAHSGANGDSRGRRVWAKVPWPSAAGEPAPAAVPAAGMNGHKACAWEGRAGRSSLHVVSLGTVDGWGRDDASRWHGFRPRPGNQGRDGRHDRRVPHRRPGRGCRRAVLAEERCAWLYGGSAPPIERLSMLGNGRSVALDGSSLSPEAVIDTLRGYVGSRPVRTGNWPTGRSSSMCSALSWS